MPFTIEALGSGTLNWTTWDNPLNHTLSYSKNGGEWSSFDNEITVNSGDLIQVKGDIDQLGDGENRDFWWNIDFRFNVFGNIMSLSYGDNFLTATTVNEYQFWGAFYEQDMLVSAERLVLPATTLAHGCYGSMFYGCTNLTAAPALPATTLASDCYSYMFYGCTSLTTAPELPATTLASACYESMFGGCTSLTSAPALPATILAFTCYADMFNGCTSLNYIKCLATDISANDCTSRWLDNVSSSGTFVKNPSMSSWTTGTDGIPTNWTVQDAS